MGVSMRAFSVAELPFLEASVSFRATVHGLGIEERSRAASAIRRQVHSCMASQPFCKSRDDVGTEVRLASLGSVGPAAPGIVLAKILEVARRTFG